jgi:hypothetical protein
MTDLPEPGDLGPGGAALWADLALRFAFDPHELPALTEACRLTDEIAALRAALTKDGRALVRGSMGQDVAQPLYAEVRAHVALRHKLLTSLGVDEAAGLDASSRGRALARQRWSA